MAIKYWIDGSIVSETFRDHIDLHAWLTKVVDTHKSDRPHVWDILKEAGRYFSNPLKEYPKNIKTPEYVKRGYCHHNNHLYAQILFDNHKDNIKDFKFVTGLWLRKTKTINPWSDSNYWAGPHSFITYQDNVLDCGAITNPPDFYEITQYFGMSFEIEHVLKAYNDLEKAGKDPEKIPVITALTHTPCLQ